MPLPHFPSDEPDEKNTPDFNDVVDRILNGGEKSVLTRLKHENPDRAPHALFGTKSCIFS